jgi:hypothetical protein
MIYPLVCELSAEKSSVAATCRVLGFSKQHFTSGAPTRCAGVIGTTRT